MHAIVINYQYIEIAAQLSVSSKVIKLHDSVITNSFFSFNYFSFCPQGG